MTSNDFIHTGRHYGASQRKSIWRNAKEVTIAIHNKTLWKGSQYSNSR